MRVIADIIYTIKSLFTKDAFLSKDWLDPEYDALFSNARLRLSRERAYVLLEALKATHKVSGNIAELGVYKGSTAYIIADYLSKNGDGKKFLLFDTFSGTPKSDYPEDVDRAGLYNDVDINEVRQFLKAFEEILVFRPGFIPDSLTGLEEERFCFLHLHLNLYSSTKDALEGLYAKITCGGIVLVEDYGLITCAGVKKATDEFFADKPCGVIHIPTGQGIVYKYED